MKVREKLSISRPKFDIVRISIESSKEANKLAKKGARIDS